MFILVGVIIIAVGLLLSFFLGAAEMALTSLSKLRVKKLIASHKSLAEPLYRWLKTPYYLLTVILTGSTVTDMILTFAATTVMVTVFHMFNENIVEFITWLVLTFIIVVFCDLVPKMIAREYAESITVRIMPFFSRVERFSKPVIVFVEKTISKFIPDFKIATNFHGYVFLSNEEVDSIISDVDKSGVVGEDIGDMLERTLNFGEISVASIMTPLSDIESADINKDNDAFLDMIIETSRSRVPVYSGAKDNIEGYIHIKDVLLKIKTQKTDDIKSLIKPAYFVEKTNKINFLMKEFQNGDTHIAFVKNDLGKIIGMVTLEDILESIIGEVIDEYELEKERK
ncbi:MAG: hemolysin family protein [Elusimicrobia bacterium]|nr:hemolysin family protein [Elusimicrobiota bacterium]